MATVVARFSTAWALAYFSGCFIFICQFLYGTAHLSPTSIFYDRGAGTVILFIGWLAAIAGLGMLFALLGQILFFKSRAIWVDSNKIYYLSKYFMAIRREAVESVSLGAFGKSQTAAIVVRLRGGGAEFIPIGYLAEEASVVVTRLRALI